MSNLALSTASTVAAALALVPDQVPTIYAWRDDLRPIVEAGKKGRMERLKAVAKRHGVPLKTAVSYFYAFQKKGIVALIDKRHHVALQDSDKPRGMSAQDKELVKLWCESYQRKNEPAIRAMLRAWREQRVSPEQMMRGLTVPQTTTPLDPTTGYPVGWGGEGRNLLRYAPTPFELKAARIGRSAASAHRPLVYTTRRHLYVGQFYLFDDMWHDHIVNDLDQRKSGRPLEFHALDLSSACKFAWGNRIRIETENGHEGLKKMDFRFLLAAVLGGTGYSPRGTTLVLEHGTANDDCDALLSDATGGALIVARGGMQGAPAHAGQYAGRSKGNFRFKASLESLGNLIHNEMAYLPGQVGMNRDHCPEEMNDGGRLIDAATGKPLARIGALKHNDALLAALSQLPPERAQWLQWDFCTIQQFRLLCEEIYARINGRREHDLEGWDERYVPDTRTGKMRRLSPSEVFGPGRRGLQPIDDDTLALLLGPTSGVERLSRNGMIELRDGEISGDVLRFDASNLPDREKFLTVLNPFDTERLFVFDAKGGFVSALNRLHSVCRSDSEAVQRAMGEAAKIENKLLQPLRQRHLQQAREKLARHRNNAAVLGGAPLTPLEKTDARQSSSLGRFADDALANAAFDLSED